MTLPPPHVPDDFTDFGSVFQSRLSSKARHCMLSEILTLFSTELVGNSSSSVELIPHSEAWHYPVLSRTYLTWTASIFGGH